MKGRSVSVGLLLTLPAVIVFLALFVAPLVNGFWLSLHEARYGLILPGLTIKQYETIFGNPTYVEALIRSIRLSVTATLITLLLSYPVAYALAFKIRKWAGVLTLFLIAPLLMNVVVRTIGWILILGRNGLINETTRALGLGEVEILYTETAVLIGYVQVFMPFMVLSILASLQTIDLNLMRASASLGSSASNTFRKILFPLSLPGVVSGCVIVFSLSSGVFVLPAILGGVRVQVLSLVAYRQTVATLNYPLGAAVAFILLAIVLAFVLTATRILEVGRYREVFRRAAA